MREIRCDQTGVLLQSGDIRHQDYLSIAGAGIFFQPKRGGFYRFGTRGKVYAFADENALDKWIGSCKAEARERPVEYGPTVGGEEPDGYGWRRKGFGDEGNDIHRD